MKTKTFICVIAIFILFFKASSQKLQPLTVGDKVPNITLHHIVHYKDSVAKLSDFKGKLLILDFWATYCTNCIGEFPHNNTLQQQFKDKLQILNVAFEPKNTITGFLSKLEAQNGAGYRITTITDDKILEHLFPHQLIPHLVWIGPDGTVKAITSAKELTDANINKLLQDGTLQVRTKKDIPIRVPLYLSKDFDSMDSLMSYSILYKGYDPGPGQAKIERQIGKSATGRLITNYSLLDIYKIIARPIFELKGEKISDQKVIVSVPDSLLNTLRSFYCFDFVVPLQQSDSLYPYMLNELNRVSGFKGIVCPQTMHCLVLKKIKDTPLLHSVSDKLQAHLIFDDNETYLKGGKLSMLVGRMNELPGVNLPVVDGTGFTGKVDISLSGSNDLSVIRKDLQKYGLDLVEEEREIYALIIRKSSNAITENQAATSTNMH